MSELTGLQEEIGILRADAATMAAEIDRLTHALANMVQRKEGWRGVAKQYRWDRNEHLLHGVRIAPDHILTPGEWIPTWSITRRELRSRRARRKAQP